MTIVYSARYSIDIGLHVFPTRKYELVHARLIDAGLVSPVDVVEPEPASWEQLALVHTGEYLEKLRTGAMTIEDIALLELPWSEEMVDGFRTMVGGTIRAALLAAKPPATSDQPPATSHQAPATSDQPPATSHQAPATSHQPPIACHIGGGLHHAFPNHGEGFCPFNDVAVAIRVLQSRGVERHAVVDVDVHHGNGTAFIFESDPRVFTFSMHQQHNYPVWKPRGSLDIGLPDGTHDATFLSELERALPKVLAHQPDCLFYLAGADPYEDDQLGGLRLTTKGLRARDRLVLEAARRASIPTVVVLAGGYARRVEDTVEIHVATIEEALHDR